MRLTRTNRSTDLDLTLEPPVSPKPLKANMEPFWDLVVSWRTPREWVDRPEDLIVAYALAEALLRQDGLQEIGIPATKELSVVTKDIDMLMRRLGFMTSSKEQTALSTVARNAEKDSMKVIDAKGTLLGGKE